ncbi:MAG: colanic acid biosynthesis phosphomannomutase CpsG [Thermoleophilia bacterium]
MTELERRLSIFKAYDVRGLVPTELDENVAYLTGRALAAFLAPHRIVVGRDMRLSGERLARALTRGLVESGVDVIDIGEVGTEQVYFATFSLDLDGGVMVTASHNPADYNGLKFVREKAIPISGDTGLATLRESVEKALRGGGRPEPPAGAVSPGRIEHVDIRESYLEHLLGYVDVGALRPLRIVANGGGGMAGPIIARLRDRLPFEFILLQEQPDGTFPYGVPNPLLPEKRETTAQAVREAGADLGLAWDGDFDRCFFFDEHGTFIEGYYLVGLLARQALAKAPGATIVHDPRLVWNTREVVEAAGGRPVVNKSGHAFIKERMRREDAVYGGEMSAHHYFRDFSYCDSGMIPWLLVTEAMSISGSPLSEMVGEMMRRYPVSGEINLELAHPERALDRLQQTYGPQALSVDEIDGVSLEFPDWRVNVRLSNTEPVLRVNLESRGSEELTRRKTQEILAFLEEAGR